MSRENVALVRSICSAWGRGDYSSVEWAHPGIDFMIADGPLPGRWSGLDGMAEGWRGWLAAWEDFHQEADEYRVIDEERVLVLFRGDGRGKTSGLELPRMNGRSAGLFRIEGGRVTSFAIYLEGERALAELGLRE